MFRRLQISAIFYLFCAVPVCVLAFIAFCVCCCGWFAPRKVINTASIGPASLGKKGYFRRRFRPASLAMAAEAAHQLNSSAPKPQRQRTATESERRRGISKEAEASVQSRTESRSVGLLNFVRKSIRGLMRFGEIFVNCKVETFRYI